jgi:hypothetical protein
MRHTYALFLELSLERLLPGFFDEIADYSFAKELAHITRGAFTFRQEFARIEVEGVKEGDEPRCRQVAERAADRLADSHVSRLEIDRAKWRDLAKWRDFGRVTVELVENATNPASAHGLGPEHPAIVCPKCSKPMIRRQGGRRPFWGCSDYPACRGTRQISE